MNRTGTLLGAALVLGVMIDHVEARMVRYEIKGQQYMYSTNNRAQVGEARQRIEAANAATAAKTKAEAELAANPLLKIVGSPAQREAAEAQARLQKVLSQEQVGMAGPEAPGAVRASRRAVAAETRNKAPSRAVSAKPPAPPAKTPVSRVANAEAVVKAAEPSSAQAQPKSAPKTVTFDLGSGIKTVQMTDGTIHEEPFDSSTVAKLGSVERASDSLTTFVDQVRPAEAKPPAPGAKN